ncbi:MAG: glycosyltransferase, partial [Chloroflexi bacterium]|nr:glycosyltransferase [Chloroflexota bacterium]
LYDAHNAETLLQQRAFETDRRSPAGLPGALYSFIQSRRLARFEAETLRRADRVLCVSQEDARALRSLVPTCGPLIIPNGIHLSGYDTFIQNSPSAISHQPSVILFTGKMDYRPNVDAALWFADAILPRIRAARPEAQFVVAWQKPHARLNVLAGRPGIVLTGTVPDIRPYLAAAAVYVAPLRMGGGTRFKLLEAMAMRKAIVSTTVGAEGFAARDGIEMLVADSSSSFADAVIILLANESKRAALGESARRFVENGYDWSAIVPRVEASYRPSEPRLEIGD